MVDVRKSPSGKEVNIAAGSVTSVFTRNGDVAPEVGDYTATEVLNDSGVPGATVGDALDNAASTPVAVPAPVTSVHGRQGTVISADGDYGSDELTNDSAVPGVSVSDALESAAASGPAGSGSLLGRFFKTASGNETVNIPAGTVEIRGELVGGGATGGAQLFSDGATAGVFCTGGGGSGGYIRFVWRRPAGFPATLTSAVGLGGNQTTAEVGVNGGDTRITMGGNSGELIGAGGLTPAPTSTGVGGLNLQLRAGALGARAATLHRPMFQPERWRS